MKKVIENENYQKVLNRPEEFEIGHRELMIAYRVLTEEMADELETMPAKEALRLFKDILLRLI